MLCGETAAALLIATAVRPTPAPTSQTTLPPSGSTPANHASIKQKPAVHRLSPTWLNEVATLATQTLTSLRACRSDVAVTGNSRNLTRVKAERIHNNCSAHALPALTRRAGRHCHIIGQIVIDISAQRVACFQKQANAAQQCR